jgi:hypothetical protein
MKITARITTLLIACWFVSCKKADTYSPEESTRFFKLDLSADWKHEKQQGIDSQVGIFYSSRDTIYYDHGYWAMQDPESLVSFYKGKMLEKYKQNGSTFWIYNISYGSGRNVYSCYVEGPFDHQKTNLRISKPSDPEKMIALMKTHRFY